MLSSGNAVDAIAASAAIPAICPPRRILAIALHALTLAINQRLAADITRFEGAIDLRVVPPLCPAHVSPLDFSQGSSLIDRARRETSRCLAQPPTTGQAVLLAPHRH